MAITDISGIGKKTAEKLRDKGINSKEELVNKFRQGSETVTDSLNSRAVSGIRESLFERGEEFTDPELGLTVGPEQQQAVETLGTTTLGDLGSVDVTQADAGDSFDVSADTTLGELAEPAAEGELGRQGTSSSVVGFASDAAANLGVTDLDSGQVQDVNRITGNASGFQTTGPSEAGLSKELPDGATERFDLDAREVARAEDFHEDRPPKAQRVDERRKAPLTDEITQWKSDPDHFDYPGVDTKASLNEFFADKRKRKAGGFGSYTTENRDKKGLKREVERIQRADDEVQEQAIGDSLEFSTGRLFEDAGDGGP
jgi:hypothetical protein